MIGPVRLPFAAAEVVTVVAVDVAAVVVAAAVAAVVVRPQTLFPV